MRYQVYFRTRRGGMGIPYELAKTEFLAVFHRFGLEVEKELRARHQMCIELPLVSDEVAALADDLGYTEAILHQRHEPYRGEEICPARKERWLVGWIRMDEWKVHLPVKHGDTIHVMSRVSWKRETSKPTMGIVSFDREIRNQRGEVVQSAKATNMYLRRSAAV